MEEHHFASEIRWVRNDEVAQQFASTMLDGDSEMASWFASGVGREELERRVTELETDGSPGDFVIGDVTGEPQCY
eukprot:gene31768-13396_t